MDPLSILADVGFVLNLAKLAIQTAQDAAPFVSTAISLVQNNSVLTDAERATLAAQEATLRDALNADSIAADQA
jgi:hypothetical protein